MFPYNIQPIEQNLNCELMTDFKGERYGFVQVGPQKWCLPASYEAHAEKFYTYPLRPDDIFLITFPRSGTTLCQELIWLLNNNLDYDTASTIPMEKRFPFLEYTILHTERFHEEISKMNGNNPVIDAKLASWRKPVYDWDVPSPRHIKTHLPFSLLPPDLTEKCKSIYVARNPKDVAVSYYHHNRLMRAHDYQGDFNKYWNYFKEGLVVFGPYWEHVIEGWEMRNKENVLFLFFEDLVKDMSTSIRKIAEFLDKSVSDSDVAKLKTHLEFENFSKKAFRHENIPIKGLRNNKEQGFFRKGKIGGNEEFTEELQKSANEWIEKKLALTSIQFPVLV